MEKTLLSLEWWKLAFARALRTFCQTLISMVTVGQAFGDVGWSNVISVCGVAALLSLAMSVVAGVPESNSAEPTVELNYSEDADVDEEPTDTEAKG